jgi:hypothetical protein
MREEQYQGLSAHADTRLPFQPVPGSQDPRNGICLNFFFVQIVLLIVSPRQIRSLLVISPDP